MATERLQRLTYTTSELQQVLGMGKRNLYRALQSGQIPNIRIGSKYLISKEAVNKWLNGNSGNGSK